VLRKAGRPLVLVANKADHLPDDDRHLAFYELGFGEPFSVSAAIGKSSGDLLDRVVELLPPAAETDEESAIHVAVVGRPNVGKSSIVNRILGQDRLVVDAEPGTTRDAIDARIMVDGRPVVLIDTAGLRKRSRVHEDIEFYATLRTARAIERADVCVLVVDAIEGMHVQDLRIASDAWERGAGLVIAVNKWDLVEEKETNTAARGERELKDRAPFLEFIPFLYVSAKTGQRVNRLLEIVLQVEAERHKRVPTAEVNRVLEELVQRQQPPQPVGESVRLFYASQIGTAPPRFAVVSNRPEAIPESYSRYLQRGFRNAWAFTGAPLDIKFRRKRKERR
jgi:GTP-binding protein